MRRMTVTEFKAHALEAIAAVAESKEKLTLTKHGRAVAELVPFEGEASHPVPGSLAHLLEHEGDIVSPLGADIWESAR